MIYPMCVLLAWFAAVPAVYRVDTVAGSGLNGDGGPAILAQLGALQGVAVDRAGNLYLSDTDHHRVRKVSGGVITTIAGNGTPGMAQLNLPYGLAADPAGNLYVADLGNNRIRRVAPDGSITTYAGGGDLPGEGVPATAAALRTPRNLALDAAGNLYVSEFEGHRVRKVTPDGRIVTVLGTGAPTADQLAYPAGLAVDRAGSLYIADSGNQRVRRLAADGTVSTVVSLPAPTAVAVNAAGALYVSGGGLHLCTPAGACQALAGAASTGDLALDSTGLLYVAGGPQVRTIDLDGAIATIAGDNYQHVGDGGPAAAALLSQPAAVALDSAGNLYIADTGANRVRQVTPGGTIQTVAANLRSPMGVAVNAAGEVIVADTGDQLVRKASGAVLASALNGPRGVCAGADGSIYAVDTGNQRVLRLPAEIAAAQLNQPCACALDASGNLLVADTGNNRVTGMAAVQATLNAPRGVAAAPDGSVFIADSGNDRILRVAPDGSVQTIAGPGQFHSPGGLALDPAGNLYVADTGNDRVRRLSPAPVTIAVVNAASLAPSPVAPGGIVSIFGDGIGPDDSAQFDGVDASVLFAAPGQINAQAPAGLTPGAPTHVQVLLGSTVLASADLQVVAAAPALFPVSIRAPRGSVAVFYATGEGLAIDAVTLTVNGIAAQVLYVGRSAGVLQVNAVIPGGFLQPGPAVVRLTVAGAVSPPITIEVE